MKGLNKLKRNFYEKVRKEALAYYDKANIILTEQEKESFVMMGFKLEEVYKTGLGVLVYVNTERVCAKEMVLLPNQTCPEHIHPNVDGQPGKEEVFRCRYGKVYLYVEGEPTDNRACNPPKGSEEYYTSFKEIQLNQGEQYILKPNIKHWFAAGDDGAVVSEFSTMSRDLLDIFTDPRISRDYEIED